MTDLITKNKRKDKMMHSLYLSDDETYFGCMFCQARFNPQSSLLESHLLLCVPRPITIEEIPKHIVSEEVI